jgi:erythromycin esterase-like protein
MLHFLDWAKKYNGKLGSQGQNKYEQISFSGLDLYSFHTSAEAVIEYLQKIDTKAAVLARDRYGAFLEEDTMSYAFSRHYGLQRSAEDAVIQVLRDLLQKRAEYLAKQFEGYRGP